MIQVREFTSADELRAHYARLFGRPATPVVVIPPAPEPVKSEETVEPQAPLTPAQAKLARLKQDPERYAQFRAKRNAGLRRRMADPEYRAQQNEKERLRKAGYRAKGDVRGMP